MGGLAQWLLEFRQLHERARRGQLSQRELQVYRSGRDELARALLAAQRLTLRPGETPRRALRVARALQVDVDLGVARDRAVTIDLSTGGFSCLLAKAPPVGDEVGFSLRLPAAAPLAGRARVTDVKVLPGNVRVSFHFANQTDADKERLELFVFDTVLGQLSS
ncbi:MAG TPA: PilZ domain-containing protein [Anaeromyxobacter sp.]|nr:PilZ domain-containing protein [Anaeromyxobacter sp.]